MFLSKKLNNTLFGHHSEIGDITGRSYRLTIGKRTDEDQEFSFIIPGDEGIIPYLLRKINKLEEQLKEIKNENEPKQSRS